MIEVKLLRVILYGNENRCKIIEWINLMKSYVLYLFSFKNDLYIYDLSLIMIEFYGRNLVLLDFVKVLWMLWIFIMIMILEKFLWKILMFLIVWLREGSVRF